MDIKAILKKVEEAEVPKVTKVAVAYSGGLDSTLGIEMLRRKYKAKEIVADLHRRRPGRGRDHRGPPQGQAAEVREGHDPGRREGRSSPTSG